MTDLKPCPNPECRSSDVRVSTLSHRVYCRTCKMSGPHVDVDIRPGEAMRLWNALPRSLDLAKAVAERDELAQHVCDECSDESGAPTGWKANRVEGRHVCVCIAESEPYQVLREAAHLVLMQGDFSAGPEWHRKGSKFNRRVQELRRIVAGVSAEELGIDDIDEDRFDYGE